MKRSIHDLREKTFFKCETVIPYCSSDGLVSYEISQGNYRDDRRHPLRSSSSLRDISYDGHRLAYGTKVGVLNDGLGQLVDGVLGLPADWNDTHNTKWIEWIGWRDTVTQRPSITFQFSSLRRFTALRIHVLNYPGIEEKMLFSKVVISFSKDGEYYAWKVIYGPGITKRRQMKDKAFWVHVNLTNNVGQYVTCEFYYQGWWALISEVQFESSVVQGISSNSKYLTHPPTHPLTQSHIHPCSHSLTHSLIHSLTHSLSHPATQPLTHSLSRPATQPSNHSLIHSLTHSPTHPPTHSLCHSLSHPTIQPTTHPLTHSLTQPPSHPAIQPLIQPRK